MANQEHLNIFRQGVSVWNEWRRENYNLKADLSYTDLSYIDFSNTSILSADMSHADLSEANLTEANFLSVDLSNSTFQNANFIKVVFSKSMNLAGYSSVEMQIFGSDPTKYNLSNTDLRYTIFKKANFSEVNFSGTDMKNIQFSSANIINSNFAKIDFRCLDLSGANFIESDLRNLELKRYRLEGSNLSKSNLSGMDLKNINFQEIDLSGANLKDVNLSSANLKRAILSDAVIDNAKCHRTDFSEANLESASLINSVCSRAIFNEANLKNIKLKMANIAHATFQEANLQNAYLYAAYAANSNFSNSDLSNAFLGELQALYANFCNANLTGVCIEDWNYNASTNLNNVSCEYIYNRATWDDEGELKYLNRIPNDSKINFKDGDFQKLIQKSQNVVDLVFRDSIDWNAFSQTFAQLESINPETKAKVLGINFRDNLLIVTVAVANFTMESDYHKNFMDGYKFAEQNLLPQYEARLRDKDKDINSKDQQINALILKGGSTQLIQNAYGVAGNVQGSQKICLPTPDTIQSNSNENEE